jgi:hypothetical protein
MQNSSISGGTLRTDRTVQPGQVHKGLRNVAFAVEYATSQGRAKAGAAAAYRVLKADCGTHGGDRARSAGSQPGSQHVLYQRPGKRKGGGGVTHDGRPPTLLATPPGQERG